MLRALAKEGGHAPLLLLQRLTRSRHLEEVTKFPLRQCETPLIAGDDGREIVRLCGGRVKANSPIWTLPELKVAVVCPQSVSHSILAAASCKPPQSSFVYGNIPRHLVRGTWLWYFAESQSCCRDYRHRLVEILELSKDAKENWTCCSNGFQRVMIYPLYDAETSAMRRA